MLASDSIQPDVRTVLEVGNVSFVVERYGTNQRPVCVLCSAINQTMASWQRYLARLLKNVNVVLWSYGLPLNPSNEGDYQSLVENLHLTVETLVAPGQKVYLLGICFGGGIAFEYAQAHSHRVRGLILSGAVVTNDIPFIEHHNALWQLYLAGHKRPVMDIFFNSLFGERMLRALVAAPDHRKKIKKKCDLTFTDAFPLLLRYLTFHLRGKSDDNALRKLNDVHVILLIGRDDQIAMPHSQKNVLRYFDDARCKCVEYEGVGHLAYLEVEQEFFTEVTAFIDACERSTEISRAQTGV
jgi:pimeloyl-ACP methyl ester carboxylesterase